MSAWSDALRILSDTEAELRKLIEQSLGQRRYDEVAVLASLVDEVSRLASQSDAEASGPILEEAGLVEPPSPEPNRRVRRGATQRTTGFPRFERDGDRLVKIAWSKHDRAEYEHRAPRHVVDALIAAIRARRGEGARFETAEIFPLRDPSTRREIPSYQAYLALAWLRHEGVVVKEGRDRYSLKPTAATPGRIVELWEALPVK